VSAGVSVNLRSPVPPFEQIRAQIASLIAVGTLAAGNRLPTVRSLASDLGLAAGTVARAYKELELAGLVETRRRNGTVVAGSQATVTPPAPAPGAVPAEVIAAVDRYIAEGRTAGLDDAALLAILRARQGRSHE
jgi:DNA-binding transcriptional regulator YhcF (GntR family)